MSEPQSLIDEKKSDLIMNAIQHYMDTNELKSDFRFDTGKVILGKGKPKIKILAEKISALFNV